MFCTACGTKNAVDSNYCKQCGHKLEHTPQTRISEADYTHALPEDEQLRALLDRAYQLRKAEDLAGAIALCQEAIQLRPESTSAHSLLGQIYASQGDRNLAIQEYERVLQLNPGSIADRVKLDELRGDAPISARTRNLSQQTAAASGNNNAGILLGSAALFLVIGSALGYLLHTRAPETQGMSAPAGNGTPAPKPSSPQAGTQGANTPSANTGNQGGAGAPVASNSSPFLNVPTYPQPIYIPYPAPGTQRVFIPAQPASEGRPRLTANVRRSTGTAIAKIDREAPSGGRIHLPGDPDDVSDNGKGQYTIRVTQPKNTDDTPGTAMIRDSVPSAPPGNQSITLSKANADTAGGSPTPEARAEIASGDNCKLREQYEQAISFYHRALPLAGDDAGVLSQKIGWCYQRLDKKDSAKTYYEKAIAEFKRLEAAGKLSDSLRDAQRSAEKGLAWSGS